MDRVRNGIVWYGMCTISLSVLVQESFKIVYLDVNILNTVHILVFMHRRTGFGMEFDLS